MNAVSIEGNILSDNSNGILIGVGTHLQPDLLVVQNNEFIDNASFGIENQHSVDVNAINNYWGSATGPYHSTLNPSGLGDEVSDKVIFEPWLGPACGDPGYLPPLGDLSGPLGVPDCKVNMYDFAILAQNWLYCNDPRDPQCGL